MSSSSDRPAPLLYLLFLLSGASALLFQVVWTKKLVLLFGATAHATGTTLAVFMAGLALGSRLFGSRADTMLSPLRGYAFLELGIALTALFSLPLLGLINSVVGGLGLSSSQSAVLTLLRILGTAVVLLPPTILMGGTLPVLAKYAVRSQRRAGRRIGVLYGMNTLGGVTGCLVAGFGFIPSWGLRTTLCIGVGINLIVALIAKSLAARADAVPQPDQPPATTDDTSAESGAEEPSRSLGIVMLCALFMGGLFGLAAEVVWTRALLLHLPATAQAFSAMLGIYLTGLALGGFVGGWLADRFARPAHGYGLLQMLAGVVIIGCLFLFTQYGISTGQWAVLKLPGAASSHAASKLVLALTLAVVLLGLPTFLMGCAFPFAARFFSSQVSKLGSRLGVACMWNTFGATVGPLAFGFIVLPALGIQTSLLVCAAGLVVSGAIAASLAAANRGRWVVGAGLVGVLTLGSFSLPEQVLKTSYDRRFKKTLFYTEDTGGSVAVTEVDTGVETCRQLVVGMTSMISDNFGCRRYTRLIGHLPAMMHPKPKRVLVICLGSGMTLNCFRRHEAVEVIDCADISEGVVQAAKEHFAEANERALEDPRVDVILQDGRTHLLVTDRQYEIISLEPPPPNNAGIANLYSKEFYELCRSRMTDEGILAQWIPYHSATLPQIRSLMGTVAEVFPHSSVWSLYDGVEYAIFGHNSDAPIPVERLQAGMRRLKDHFEPVGIRSLEDVLACFVMGPNQLQTFVGNARPVTDDRPGIGYDWEAFDRLNIAAPTFARDVAHANMETLRHAEDPAALFRFSSERNRAAFAQRFTTTRTAWLMHDRATTIHAELRAGTFKEDLRIDRNFVAPVLMDPGNAYYEHANKQGLYLMILTHFVRYYIEQNESLLAAQYSKQALQLDALRGGKR